MTDHATRDPIAVPTTRFVDRTTGWLGLGFVLMLLATEVVLSLPSEHATALTVASFYAEHRAFIVILQILGIVATALLALFAWRLRRLRPGVAIAGLVLAATTLAPGLITLALAVVADPHDPNTAGTLNRLEPRGDDLLFIGVVVFASTVAVLVGGSIRWLGLVATVVALCCLIRLVLEAFGQTRGTLETLAPLSFLALIGSLCWLAFRGYPVLRPAR
jgi:hypothetical protein